MFTGLIEKTAYVKMNQQVGSTNRLVIDAHFDKLQPGESVAVNGVCLTVLPCDGNELHFDMSPETIQVTTLGNLSVGSSVNLERAMVASTRFGGHYVSGHVDKVAQVESIQTIDGCIAMVISGFSLQDLFYLVPKGSLTVEGVSLTINDVTNQSVKLMLIPHTLNQTNLGGLKVGQHVNIEFDYLTRIVAHQLQIAGKLQDEVKQ